MYRRFSLPLRSRRVARVVDERSPEWVEVPNPSKDVLRDRMLDLYWVGVAREIVLLICTLRSWQMQEHANVYGEDEVLRPEDMHGFGAFVQRAVGRANSLGVYA